MSDPSSSSIDDISSTQSAAAEKMTTSDDVTSIGTSESNLSTQSSTSEINSTSDDTTSTGASETTPTTIAVEASDDSPPKSPSSPGEADETFVDKYAATVIGCGYLRLSCQIIDRYLMFGSPDDTIPTKLEVDAKYVKMLESMVQKQVREIIGGTEKIAVNVALKGLFQSRDDAMKEKDSETALKVWDSFEVASRVVSSRSSSWPSSMGGDSLRTVSNSSSNASKDDSVPEEQLDHEMTRGRVEVPLIRKIQKPEDSENLFVRRTRRSSTNRRSRLGMVSYNADSETGRLVSAGGTLEENVDEEEELSRDGPRESRVTTGTLHPPST